MLEINDKVIQVDRPELGVGVILGITHDPEALYSIDFPFLRCTRRAYQLKPYEEMKEKRNITLTLEKAKEWYKKGGELKEIALQAFTEKELNSLPRSWEEFCKNYPVKKGECVLESEDKISVTPWSINIRRLKTWIPSKKSAEAHLAMIQLEQLRDCWRQGWKPTKYDTAYHIIQYPKEYSILPFCFRSFLSFPTKEMAEEFLKCFRDLIEKAGDLI